MGIENAALALALAGSVGAALVAGCGSDAVATTSSSEGGAPGVGGAAGAGGLGGAGGAGGEVGGAGGAGGQAMIPYGTLSEYGFYEGPLADQKVKPGIFRYDVTAALWADYAAKDRYIVLPEGGQIGLTDREDWQFPIGTIIIKTFKFPLDRRDPTGEARPVETRLLILQDDGWSPQTYVWNDALTDATRSVAGEMLPVSYIDETGAHVDQLYNVPNLVQCRSCHVRDDVVHLLGLITPQTNRDVTVGGTTKNQLTAMFDAGLIAGAAPDPTTLEAYVDPFGAGPIDARARSYLGANCSHCHRPGGGGGDSGLVLLQWETDPSKYGVCKDPAAAGSGAGGHLHDIEPGSAADSIIPFRMSSADPDIKMPELGNLQPDLAGVDVVSAWIDSLAPVCP